MEARCTREIYRKVEFHVHVFAETGGVVISIGLCVAKCFKDRIGLEEFIFDHIDTGLLPRCSRDKLQHFL